MELRRYTTLLLKWWWLLILGTALASGGTYLVSKSQDPVYSAMATLLVNPAPNDNVISFDNIMTSERLSRTYAELIRKPRVLDAVREKLGIPKDVNMGVGVTVRVVPNTQLLELVAESEDPAQAQLLANTITEVFIQQRLDDQTGETSASRSTLRQQISQLEGEMKLVSDQLDQAKAAQQSLEAARLQSMLNQDQLTYSQLLQAEQSMVVAEARTFSSVKLAQPATQPGSPIRPRVRFNTMLAALGGLVLAFGAAFLIEYLDDTIKAAADVQASIGLPTLGSVARFASEKGQSRGPHLLDETSVRSHLGESYRILRANIDFAWAGEPGKVLMCTSSHSGEGKTTTVINLATVLARDNRTVIAVDADLRKPWLHRAFNLESRRGLSNLLADPTAQVADFILPTPVPNLSVIPCGPVPPNPSELIGSPRFAAVLDQLRGLADLVLVDTPPVLAVVDPALIGARADGVLMVVEVAGTRIQSLMRAVDVLSHGSARMLGVVLNKLTRQSDDYYYHYYHYYSYSDRSKQGSSNGSAKERQEANA